METKAVNILLVEDDEVDVMNVQRAFKKNNMKYPLAVAGNGIEALEHLRSSMVPRPKIILLDINMPRMNGLEFLKELRKDLDLRYISVFILTTSNDYNDMMVAYELNVAGYILKPVSTDKFLSAIATLNAYWKLLEFPGT